MRGFTLLELLVVIVVISIASAMLVVKGSPSAGNYLQSEGQKLGQLLRIAQQHALLKSRTLRWVPEAKGYRFESLEQDRWMPVQDESALRPRAWGQEGLSAVVLVDGLNRSALTLDPAVGLQQRQVILQLQNSRVLLESRSGANFVLGKPQQGRIPAIGGGL